MTYYVLVGCIKILHRVYSFKRVRLVFIKTHLLIEAICENCWYKILEFTFGNLS